MSARRGARVGVGLMLIVLGLAGMLGRERPADGSEAVGFYGFDALLIGFGLWFILRRAKPKSSPPPSEPPHA